MTTHLNLTGTSYKDTDVTSLVESNIISFFDWGFTDCGGYTNVYINISGGYGDFARLKPANDLNFSSGRVWEGIRGNWVWESGLAYGTPIRISGVYVNNVYTTSGYQIDYPNGRVIFNNPISTSSIVKLNHSYKEVQVTSCRDNPLFKQVQYRSRKPDETGFLISSGNYTGYATNKINLPTVSVEVISRGNSPYQLGGGKYSNYTVKFHILGESDFEVKRISDLLVNQEEKTIFAYDLDSMALANAFPLNFNGTLASGAKCYPDLVSHSGVGGYRTILIDQGKIRFHDCKSQTGKWIHQNLYMTTVDMSAQVILPPR